MAKQQDRELQQYSDLVDMPTQFDRVFGVKMIVGALFLGFLMVPASIYLSLFMGGNMSNAARWVTVILFAEVAKRSMKGLRKQEIFLLFYMTGVALSGQVHGGILSQLLWNQYLVQSPAMISMGVADQVPSWISPSREILENAPRSFFTAHWMAPIAFLVGVMLIQRIDQFGLGYALYRLTAHVEKLPFPMAPVDALGITAMAEGDDTKEPWKWRYFSLGGMLGMAFGAIYVGVPAVTGTLFGTPIQIIPIPWLDFTSSVSTENFMPAVPLNLVFDLGLVITGMVLPFWAVVGGFLGLLFTWLLNPILYHNGVLTGWTPGMTVVDTFYNNHIDFYLSFSIGLAGAIFLISVGSVIRPLLKVLFGRARQVEEQATRRGWRDFAGELLHRNRSRGDIPILISLAIYLFSSAAYIVICMNIVPGFTGDIALFFAGFAFIYQPIISYVNAKLEGMVGQTVQIPMVREAAFIFSGYTGAAIWFAPIPLADYSVTTRNFRVMELTGTRLTDVIKVELLTIPILLVCSLLFCELIWRMAPIPSETYPFTLEVWDLQAKLFALQVTATTEGTSEFLEAVQFDVIGWGMGAGLVSFIVLSALNLPTFLIFGAVRGLGQTMPGMIVLEMVGALIGRFYLQRRLGHQNFKRYVMVMFAGYSAGVGLIAMGAVAIAWIVKSTTPLGY